MGVTTHPSVSTDQVDSARRRPTHVRWVFPEPRRTLLATRVVVGRDDSCQTVLPGTQVSRQHAEFRVDGPLTAVRDLGSSNGIVLNGQRVADAPLAIGDVLRLGEWVGVVVHETDVEVGFQELHHGWFGGALLRSLLEPVRRVKTDLPLVVQGETGTGKEGLARAAHTFSGRGGTFVPVNCATLTEQLAEAELFGHKKGAFTGADSAGLGLFRAADRGTLFLDEVLELSLPLQAKLLRVLQEQCVRPVGETRDVPIDVRVIAATQEPLSAAVADRRFRADLHARLDGLTVVLPPLRARREDIVPLFLGFLQRESSKPPALEPKLAEALCLYDWPLNVRELGLLARRSIAVHEHEPTLKKAHLPERMRSRETGTAEAPPAATREKRAWRKADDQAEFGALIVALREQGGSVARAAAALGISRARAYRVLSAHPDFSLEAVRES